MTKKILFIINPVTWIKILRQCGLWLYNIIFFQNFSFNLNSKKYWDKRLSRFEKSWRDENYYHIINFLPKNKPFSLLDVGCALGDGCVYLHKKFPKAKIIGTDISTTGIAKARKYNKDKNIEYLVLNILKQPLPQKYDYITIVETLEHFDDPFIVVDKCLKYVKKALIISTPYTPEETGKINKVGEHRYNFNKTTFKNYKVKKTHITQYLKSTNNRCIVYELLPK